ncbi:MAG: helix-turn-helix transcriptional regulator [Promethearchaeota archaeon]
MTYHKMKGFLSFLILWVIKKRKMMGMEITLELEKRKGRKLSPGTIYPVLKKLKKDGLLAIDENKCYTLTELGIKELKNRLGIFLKTFPDIDDMKDFLKKNESI